MGSLTADIKDAKKAADPMTVARFARLKPEWGVNKGAKFFCPIQKDGKSWASFFKKTKGENVGELGFGCKTCETEVASGTRKGMPDAMVALMHALDCSLPDALAWLQQVNKGKEPMPPAARSTPRPATAPKMETWDPTVKGTKLGLGVLFGAPGARDEAENCLYVALTAADYESARAFQTTHNGEDPDKVSLVYVDSPEQWTALRTILPAKMSGEILYRAEPSKSHMELLAFAESKGCTFDLIDLNKAEARRSGGDEADGDEADQDEPVAAPRESLASKHRAIQDAIASLCPPEDPPVKAPTTPIAPSVQVPTTPVGSSVQVQKPTEPPAQGVVRTPEPAPVAVSTLHTTPPDEGRPVRPQPAKTYADYAQAVGPRAQALLLDLLAGGPVAGREVVLVARANGISKGQIHAARDALGIACARDGWLWSLPSR